jgi:parallel beta-helix repeat protein
VAPPPPPPPPPPGPLPGTDIRTLGAKGDGVTDDTAAIRNAAASGRVLNFPKTSAFYLINGVIDLTNSVYSNGGEVRCPQDGSLNTIIFRITSNAAQLTVDGFVLNGLYHGQGSNTGPGPQYSMGIAVYSVSNVTLSNNTIHDNFGDGIYVGGNGSAASTALTVKGNTITAPYRNCMSIVNVDGLTVSNNTLNKTFDTNAGAKAIDFEPDPPPSGQYTRNMTIAGNTINAQTMGIQVGGIGATRLTGLSAHDNIVHGAVFMIDEVGAIDGANFKANQFTSTGQAPQGIGSAMFYLAGVTNTTLDSNVDHTPCAGGYRSVVQYNGSTLTLVNNTFC